MTKGGFDPAKMVVLNNFLDPIKFRLYQSLDHSAPRQYYYCYVGRLSQEKGVADLLEVASHLPYKLKVAGGGPLEQELRSKYGSCPQIEFMEMLDATAVGTLLTDAMLSVAPSQCYENNPLSVIESLSAGTPVAGAQIGGIPELIDEQSGVVFQPFDHEAMSTAITTAMNRQWNHAAIASRSLQRFSAAAHYQSLLHDVYLKG